MAIFCAASVAVTTWIVVMTHADQNARAVHFNQLRLKAAEFRAAENMRTP